MTSIFNIFSCEVNNADFFSLLSHSLNYDNEDEIEKAFMISSFYVLGIR